MIKITKTNAIDPALERALHALEAVCKDEGQKQAAYLNGELNFNKSLPYVYLAHDESGALAGFIVVFMPVMQAEIYAYTRPDQRGRGVFKALIREVENDLRAAGVKRLLFQTEPCAKTAISVRKKLYPDAALDRIEYTMQRPRGETPPDLADKSGVGYVRVTRENLKTYCALSNAAFDDYEDDETSEMNLALCDSDKRAAYMAVNRDGEPVGAVCVTFEYENGEKQAFIYGLCVRSDARRKGIGRALLLRSLQTSFADKDIVRAKLDVEINNPNALELYRACGFEEVCTVEYWASVL